MSRRATAGRAFSKRAFRRAEPRAAASFPIRANPYPGESATSNRSSTRKKRTPCVQPGVRLMRARSFRPSRRLTSVDFPQFDLPAMSTQGCVVSGISPGRKTV